MRIWTTAAAGACALAAAGAAQAETRYYAFEADGQAARHRTGDLTIAMERGLLSARPVQLFRRRGADLPLGRPDRSFRLDAVAPAVGGETRGLRVYPVERTAGEGFAHGACEGAREAWVAIPEVVKYRPLRLHVLTRGADGAPVLCETLDYRWRSEWSLPPSTRAAADDQPTRGPF